MNNLIPRIGVGAIIVKIHKNVLNILLGHRLNKEGHGHNEWAFPGGKLDWMETIKECAKRETWEETGLIIKPDEEIGYTNDFWPTPINKHFLTIYVICYPTTKHKPRVLEYNKCAEWKWFPIDAMPQNMMLGAAEILKNTYSDFRQV